MTIGNAHRLGGTISPEEMLRYRRSLLRESLDGKYVKSFGEKVIANFLFEHDIKYIYEKKFRWDGGNYRPDFTIDRHRVVIEYFGLKGSPIMTRCREKAQLLGKQTQLEIA